MFSFTENFAGDEKGVEGAKIIRRTPDFNNKTNGVRYYNAKKCLFFFQKILTLN